MKRRIPTFLRYHLRNITSDGPKEVVTNGDDSSFDCHESTTPPKRQLRVLVLKSALLLLVCLISLHSITTMRILEYINPQQSKAGTIEKTEQEQEQQHQHNFEKLYIEEKKRIAEKLQEHYKRFRELEQQLKELDIGEKSQQLYSSLSSRKGKLATKLQEQAHLISQLQNTMIAQQKVILEMATETSGKQILTPMPTEPGVVALQQSNSTIQTMTLDSNTQTNSIADASLSGLIPENTEGAGDETSLYNLELTGYKNSWDPNEETDTAVFWQISKVGVKAFKKIMGECHHLVMSSKEGVIEGHEDDEVSASCSLVFLSVTLIINIFKEKQYDLSSYFYSVPSFYSLFIR